MSSNKNTKKQLIQKIEKLSETEHMEIFKMLTSNSVHYTQNNNGVFLNLSNVQESLIQQISEFVDFCIMNKIQLDEYEKKIHECKRNNKFNIESEKNDEFVSQEQEFQNEKIPANWTPIIDFARNKDNVLCYVDELLCAKEKKKSTSKFNSAKKKYSKRFFDKKNENDNNVLEYEDFLF